MRKLTKEELENILENHLHWFYEDCEGWENMQAVLRNTDLSNVDLSEFNLSGADLSGADLSGADLRGARLRETKLYEANLTKANLRGTDLRIANLCGACLYEADLCNSELCDTDLRNANLYGANLYGANLRGANLRRANLQGANLLETIINEADLRGADLSGSKNVPFIPFVCPDTKSFTGWKKGLIFDDKTLDLPFDVIIELEVPEDAHRSSATSRKCRCDKAIVKSITSLDGSESFNIAYSKYDCTFRYKVGETVFVNNFDEDRFKECAPGIHFFINRQEAVNYLI